MTSHLSEGKREEEKNYLNDTRILLNMFCFVLPKKKREKECFVSSFALLHFAMFLEISLFF